MTVFPVPVDATGIRHRAVFVATFVPRIVASMEIMRQTGARGPWRVLWIVEDGPYRGEYACVPIGRQAPGLSWAPVSELIDREPYAEGRTR